MYQNKNKNVREHTTDSFLKSVSSSYILCCLFGAFVTANEPNAQYFDLNIYITLQHRESLHISDRKRPSLGKQNQIVSQETWLVGVYSVNRLRTVASNKA
jgi:hypothetical protein